MSKDEEFVEALGDGCMQVVFLAMVFWTVVGCGVMLIVKLFGG